MKLIVGMTGATGVIYGVRLLQRLREAGVETHLVISKWGVRTLLHETPYTREQVEALATEVYQPTDMGAAISSGSYELIVLDEVTYPMNWGWIDAAEVVSAIRERPAHVNIVATGRDAPEALLALADTATNMVKLRHVYDRGVRARRGIDF